MQSNSNELERIGSHHLRVHQNPVNKGAHRMYDMCATW